MFCVVLLCCSYTATALADIYKCTINGKTVFTDEACDDGEQLDVQIFNTVQTVRTADIFYDSNTYSSNQWFEGAADYRRALQLAETHQAPMLVYFYTAWCQYSVAVSTKLLPDPVAVDAMNFFIKVRMNPEHGDAENTIFKSMGGKGYPRLVVIPYEKQWRRISVTYNRDENRPEKHLSTNEFVANLAPFQPPRPLPTARDHHERARTMFSQGNQKQAVKDAKTAISREPHQFDHYKLLDDILMKERDFAQIITYWNSFIRLSPENDQAYLERAGAHRHNGDMNAAIADLKKAAELGNRRAAQLYRNFQ